MPEAVKYHWGNLVIYLCYYELFDVRKAIFKQLRVGVNLLMQTNSHQARPKTQVGGAAAQGPYSRGPTFLIEGVYIEILGLTGVYIAISAKRAQTFTRFEPNNHSILFFYNPTTFYFYKATRKTQNIYSFLDNKFVFYFEDTFWCFKLRLNLYLDFII